VRGGITVQGLHGRRRAEVAWNKRGNTGGGASTGSGGTKRGGSARTPITDDAGGVLDCPRCLGEKEIGNPAAEQDEDGVFTGRDLQRCPRCNGTGTVRGR
jgi:hypothetical protein